MYKTKHPFSALTEARISCCHWCTLRHCDEAHYCICKHCENRATLERRSSVQIKAVQRHPSHIFSGFSFTSLSLHLFQQTRTEQAPHNYCFLVLSLIHERMFLFTQDTFRNEGYALNVISKSGPFVGVSTGFRGKKNLNKRIRM